MMRRAWAAGWCWWAASCCNAVFLA
jgi:hypothetical protein